MFVIADVILVIRSVVHISVRKFRIPGFKTPYEILFDLRTTDVAVFYSFSFYIATGVT